MKQFAILLFLSGFFTTNATAQLKYPVKAIPDSILKEAHVVKRLEEITFELVDLTNAVYKRKQALTILDDQGQRYAAMVVGYDKLRKIADISGTLYDASGNTLKKAKGKEINDYSATSDISLYEDNRMKVHDFNYRGYPYTVEYEVEIRYNNTYAFPDWTPQTYEHLAVERSSFTFITPATYNLRYKTFNCKAGPVSTTEKDKKVLRWEVANLAPVTKPFASPPWHELTPTVFFAPSDFQMEGYKGNATTWEEYGKFKRLLYENRDNLPADIQQKAKAIAAASTDPKETVRKLYEFMQQHTRYISIQLGIGGLQPFDAAFVAQKGYGDCKALSNYMYSLLKTAGIRSYCATIQAGESADDQYLMEDFPSHQSNHVVLCVPLAKDTVWLECTNQTLPAGYMGSFTGNRKALAITEEGGKLVNTPRYGLNENLQVRKISGVVDEEGNLNARVTTQYKAMQQDDLHGMLNHMTREQVKKMLNEHLNFSTYEINDFAYASKTEVVPEVEETLQISVSGYASVSGRRLFIVPNLMSRSGYKSLTTEDRTSDFVFSYAYRDVDTIQLQIPADYKLEAMPPNTELKTAYGNYSSTVKVEGSSIFYYRKMERFAGRFAAKEALQIARFYEDIYKTDRSRIVLVKKEG